MIMEQARYSATNSTLDRPQFFVIHRPLCDSQTISGIALRGVWTRVVASLPNRQIVQLS